MLIQLSNHAWVDPERVICVKRMPTQKPFVILYAARNDAIAVFDFPTPELADAFIADTGRRINKYLARRNNPPSVAGHMTRADHAINQTVSEVMADFKAQAVPKEGE